MFVSMDTHFWAAKQVGFVDYEQHFLAPLENTLKERNLAAQGSQCCWQGRLLAGQVGGREEGCLALNGLSADVTKTMKSHLGMMESVNACRQRRSGAT